MISQNFKILTKTECQRFEFIEGMILLCEKMDIAVIADKPEETDDLTVYQGEGL